MKQFSFGRAIGTKLFSIAVLALLMLVPVLFVSSLVTERSDRASQVESEISSLVGGAQTLLGPTLLIPYRVRGSVSVPSTGAHRLYVVFPVKGAATVKTATEVRHRSLFEVPVYRANVVFDGEFDLSQKTSALPDDIELDWKRAELVEGVSDPRGVTADITASIDGKAVTLVPAQLLATLGDPQKQRLVTLIGSRMGEIAAEGARFHVTSTLHLSGAQQLSVLAFGKATSVTVTGDWKDPGFEGAFLPVSRTLESGGFSAKWSVPFVARGVAEAGTLANIAGISGIPLTTSFIEMADPYQSVNRSMKYALLFVGMVFLSYFVFEVTSGMRIHLAQYALVGIAQMIFYLLLLSLAERLGFDWSFLLAGGATVGLLSANVAWVFASRLQAVRALGVFALLYALIYLLLRLEDNALLVGAVSSFAIVAAVMYVTRGIDWYGAREPLRTTSTPAMANGSAGQ